MPIKHFKCNHCGNEYHFSAELCPHCYFGGRYGNVHLAEDEEEQNALNRRYDTAKSELKSRDAEKSGDDFENSTKQAKAIIGLPLFMAKMLIHSDTSKYASYYERLDGDSHLPYRGDLEAKCLKADAELFPGFHKKIKFAALSLDGVGVLNYARSEIEKVLCFLICDEKMIEHRATVFEKNSTVFYDDFEMVFPKGYRGLWKDRGRICLAKLYEKLSKTTQPSEFKDILLTQGHTSWHDDFVEVHIFGPMTIRSFRKVSLSGLTKRQQKAQKYGLVPDLKKALKKYGIELETNQ